MSNPPAFSHFITFTFSKTSVLPDTAPDEPKMETPKAGSQARASFFTYSQMSASLAGTAQRWLCTGLSPPAPQRG